MNGSSEEPDDAIVAVAQKIRDELAASDQAGSEDIVRRLGPAIDNASRAVGSSAEPTAQDELFEILASHPDTRSRMHELLPADSEWRGFEALTITAGPVAVDSYNCSQCGYRWPVLSVDDPVSPPQNCPADGTQLVFHAAYDAL